VSSLLRFVLKRVGGAIPLLFGLVTLVFFLSRLLPGDATTLLFLSPAVPPAVAEQLKDQFGLNRPVTEQYLLWLGSVSRGQLGFSITQKAPVLDVLASVFPNTVVLGLVALFLEMVITIVLASLAVRHAGSKLDILISNGTLIVYALPTFWIGLTLVSLFSYRLGLFPASQMHSVGMSGSNWADSLSDLLLHVALPALTIAIPGSAGLARYVRSSISATLNQEYVTAARGMGLSQNRIFLSYVLPNSLTAMVSLLGIELGILLTGVVVTETLFAWPGMGRVVVNAMFARDYPLILGCTIVAGIVVIFGNVIADVTNALIDPRIRLTR
jgi:peptide/nickel transport system permease protein